MPSGQEQGRKMPENRSDYWKGTVLVLIASLQTFPATICGIWRHFDGYLEDKQRRVWGGTCVASFLYANGCWWFIRWQWTGISAVEVHDCKNLLSLTARPFSYVKADVEQFMIAGKRATSKFEMVYCEISRKRLKSITCLDARVLIKGSRVGQFCEYSSSPWNVKHILVA